MVKNAEEELIMNSEYFVVSCHAARFTDFWNDRELGCQKDRDDGWEKKERCKKQDPPSHARTL